MYILYIWLPASWTTMTSHSKFPATLVERQEVILEPELALGMSHNWGLKVVFFRAGCLLPYIIAADVFNISVSIHLYWQTKNSRFHWRWALRFLDFCPAGRKVDRSFCPAQKSSARKTQTAKCTLVTFKQYAFICHIITAYPWLWTTLHVRRAP